MKVIKVVVLSTAILLLTTTTTTLGMDCDCKLELGEYLEIGPTGKNNNNNNNNNNNSDDEIETPKQDLASSLTAPPPPPRREVFPHSQHPSVGDSASNLCNCRKMRVPENPVLCNKTNRDEITPIEGEKAVKIIVTLGFKSAIPVTSFIATTSRDSSDMTARDWAIEHGEQLLSALQAVTPVQRQFMTLFRATMDPRTSEIHVVIRTVNAGELIAGSIFKSLSASNNTFAIAAGEAGFPTTTVDVNLLSITARQLTAFDPTVHLKSMISDLPNSRISVAFASPSPSPSGTPTVVSRSANRTVSNVTVGGGRSRNEKKKAVVPQPQPPATRLRLLANSNLQPQEEGEPLALSASVPDTRCGKPEKKKTNKLFVPPVGRSRLVGGVGGLVDEPNENHVIPSFPEVEHTPMTPLVAEKEQGLTLQNELYHLRDHAIPALDEKIANLQQQIDHLELLNKDHFASVLPR